MLLTCTAASVLLAILAFRAATEPVIRRTSVQPKTEFLRKRTLQEVSLIPACVTLATSGDKEELQFLNTCLINLPVTVTGLDVATNGEMFLSALPLQVQVLNNSNDPSPTIITLENEGEDCDTEHVKSHAKCRSLLLPPRQPPKDGPLLIFPIREATRFQITGTSGDGKKMHVAGYLSAVSDVPVHDWR